MKKVFGKLLILLFALTTLVYADESYDSCHSSACEKIYLDPNQVAITEDGIFCLLNNQWMATEAVHYDAAGLFITNASEEWSIRWTCPKCGHRNSVIRNACENCGYRPAK